MPATGNPKSEIRNPKSGRPQPRVVRNRRSAFTLVEMMIAILVIIILAAIAIPIAGTLNRNESIAGTSRQVRSFLEGARDRAIHSKLPRGVRFLTDENDPTIITSMVYVGPAGNLSIGNVTVSNDSNTPPRPRVLTISPASAATTWNNLWAKGLIPDGSVLRLKSTSGGTSSSFSSYTIVNSGGTWLLTRNFRGVAGTTLNGALGDYVLELGNSVLPNQEPRILEAPIDLAHCVVPPSWNAAGGNRDILFSPAGNVIGDAAAVGHIHLIVTSLVDKDATPDRGPGNTSKQDPEIIVTVTTQTGAVTAHSVYSPADPWRNAETGVETE